MRLQDRPRFRAGASVSFDDFLSAMRALRQLSQAGLYPANCRVLDPGEALTAGAGDGTEAVMVLAFEAAGHDPAAWMGRALECCADHGGRFPAGAGQTRTDASGAREGAAGEWRRTFLNAPYYEKCWSGWESSPRPSRPRDHLGSLPGFPSGIDGGGARRGGASMRRRRLDNVPHHARISRRPGAILHGHGARAGGQRTGELGRDQAGGIRHLEQARRDDHSSSRGRPRPSLMVRARNPEGYIARQPSTH